MAEHTIDRPARPWLAGPVGVAPDGGRTRLRSLVLMRWVAVAGQAAALIVVYFGFGFELPLAPALALVGASVLVNLHAWWTRAGGAWLGDRAVTLYLAFDLVQLALLMALTGGLSNPFALLILAPVTVSASLLSRRSTVILACLAVLAVTALAFWHLPLPWRAGGFTLPPVFVTGIWVALVLAVAFIAVYVFSVAAEAQRVADALSATQMALAREQRLSALGGLAAAAAHELGSPLGTIAVVARELAGELPEDSPFREDAELLLSESARCRDILARLAAEPEGDAGAPYHSLPLSALAEAAAAAYRREGVSVEVVPQPPAAEGDAAQPVVPRSPEVLHGLGALIQNAVGFAESRVEILARWDTDTIEIAVRDDGPGFPPGVLRYLGEPYVSDRRGGEEEHMGLGVFIARTLLARSGARVGFANRRDRGAEVRVSWPRAALERAIDKGPGAGARSRRKEARA